jgi:hypothetical protein
MKGKMCSASRLSAHARAGKIGTLPHFRRFYPRAEALRARDATEETGNREASH